MILDKAKMAHDYLLKLMETNPKLNAKYATEFVWEMVDAMQAEADKRKPIPKFPALQQTFIDGVEQPRYAPSCDEWQPDWSDAPDNMTHFAVDANGSGWFFNREPHADSDSCWYCGDDSAELKNHGYTGDWQDSLRKRPQ